MRISAVISQFDSLLFDEDGELGYTKSTLRPLSGGPDFK
jgi:hypothetical protein